MSSDSAPEQIVFEKWFSPIDAYIRQQQDQLPKDPKEKLTYYYFFKILAYFFLYETGSLKLFINAKLRKGLVPDSLNLIVISYSAINESFSRFPIKLFQDVFYYLINTLPLKTIPELAILGLLYCIDGSVFPVIHSMEWARYTSKHQALKFHLCFELNRMIPVEFLVTDANSSERQALLDMLKESVTYIADRGYMSFELITSIVAKNAHFVFRVKENIKYVVHESLLNSSEKSSLLALGLVTDELISYVNDPLKNQYRLVKFSIGMEVFSILTDRRDLTTTQVISLYAYRWQVELIFRFLKRTMNGIHLVKHCQHGVTIQFYMILIVALLNLHLKQTIADLAQEQECKKQATSNALLADHSTQSSKASQVSPLFSDFTKTVGENINRYWKIGIYWLTVLREILIKPFNEHHVSLLADTS